MWRSAFARATHPRHATRNFSRSYVSKVTFSNSLNPPECPHWSSKWSFPRTSCSGGLRQNLLFFSQHSTSAEISQFESQTTDSNVDDSLPGGQDREVSIHLSEVVDANDNTYMGNDENDDTQIKNDAPFDGIAEDLEESLEENGELQMGAFDEEEKVVYEIDEEKLENLLSVLQSSADGSLESIIGDMDLTLHEEFMMRVIETPLVLGDNLIRFFNWAWKEKSLKVTSRIVESLVLAVCNGLRKKEIYSLWDLLKDIGYQEKEVLNVEILNELIISLSKLGKGKAALEVFDKFEEFGCVPNADTYYFTVEALCRRSTFDWAWSVCQKMLDANVLPDAEKVGKMISWFCKANKTKCAHTVYAAAIEKDQHPPMSSFNFLAGKLCQENETVQLALEMLNDIPKERKKHSIKAFSAVVRALCRIQDVDAAKQLISKMITEAPPPGNAVFNSIITGYAKVGDMGKALEMKTLMESRGLKPDVYTYTILISGYSNGDEMEEASKVLAEAKEKHSKLSPVTYHTLIRGYCKLEQFDKALELFAEMKDFGVQPTVDEYEKLIQSLCLKALDWEMAEKLQEEMKGNGLYLKGITRALIRAVKQMETEGVETKNINSLP